MIAVQEMITRIIAREGGYVDHPADRGGPTNMGVTLDALSEYRGVGVTAADVRNLTRAEAESIYYERYWVDPGFDGLAVSDTVAEMLLDMSVHHGPFGAVKLLQQAIHVKPDGKIGPITETMVNIIRGPDLAAAIMGERVAKLGAIITKNPSQVVFAAGWMNRMKELINLIPGA